MIFFLQKIQPLNRWICEVKNAQINIGNSYKIISKLCHLSSKIISILKKIWITKYILLKY